MKSLLHCVLLLPLLLLPSHPTAVEGGEVFRNYSYFQKILWQDQVYDERQTWFELRGSVFVRQAATDQGLELILRDFRQTTFVPRQPNYTAAVEPLQLAPVVLASPTSDGVIRSIVGGYEPALELYVARLFEVRKQLRYPFFDRFPRNLTVDYGRFRCPVEFDYAMEVDHFYLKRGFDSQLCYDIDRGARRVGNWTPIREATFTRFKGVQFILKRLVAAEMWQTIGRQDKSGYFVTKQRIEYQGDTTMTSPTVSSSPLASFNTESAIVNPWAKLKILDYIRLLNEYQRFNVLRTVTESLDDEIR